MKKRFSILTTSVFLLAILAFAIPQAVAAPSFTLSAWSDELPTVDGDLTASDAAISDHAQVSVDIGPLGASIVAVSQVFAFMAVNSTHMYFAMNMTSVPYLANLQWDDAQGEPTSDPSNITMIRVFFDNNNNTQPDQYEDGKAIYYGNDTFSLAEDLYYDATEDDFVPDESSGHFMPGNIIDWNITHTDEGSPQLTIGDLTVEMFFEIDGTDLYDGNPPLQNGRNITFAIQYMAMINADLTAAGGDNGPPPADVFLMGELEFNVTTPEEGIKVPELGDWVGFTNGPLTGNFTIDGDVAAEEASDTIHPPDTYSMSIWMFDMTDVFTSTFDIYAVNNDTHLYIGVNMSNIPYNANITWNSSMNMIGFAVHNFTIVRVIFDNDNDDILDKFEDAKMIVLGNNSLAWADDLYWNDTEDGPFEAGFAFDSESGHGFPPDQGDITEYAVQHSNPSAQGAIGVLTMELTMLLADDASGYDGGGLSGTVGFSIQYQSFINFNITEEEEPELEMAYAGMSAGQFADDDASDFDNLVIDAYDPVISGPADFSFEEGATGQSITWTASDANPNMYSITMNSSLVPGESGDWDGDDITLNLDDLSLTVGTYSFVCSVNDTYGHSASDEVIVTVTEAVSEFSYGYAFIALITLPLIALIAYRKTRKLKV